MIIYVASPYGRRINLRHKTREENVWRSIEAGRQLLLKGHTPFLPLLYHFVHADWNKTPREDIWHNICLVWMYKCEAVLRLEGRSIGADDEVAKAKVAGLKIYYDIDEVPNES